MFSGTNSGFYSTNSPEHTEMIHSNDLSLCSFSVCALTGGENSLDIKRDSTFG